MPNMTRYASLFNQLLQQFPKSDFQRLVNKHQTERNAKGFTSWSQFVSMLFCHFARADSLREISYGLACCIGKLSHLGLKKAPPKSTLAYANANRSAGLYEELFYSTLALFRSRKMLGTRKRFKFKNKLVSFDSTVIALALEAVPWAKYRSRKGGIKLHVLLDNADLMPDFVCMTEARVNDCKGLKMISLKPGTIVAMDRGYNDFKQFGDWTEQGVYFVTRMKMNTKHHILKRRIPPQNRHILSDQIIILTGARSDRCAHDLRLVRAVDPETGQVIDILTNNLDLGASTISGIYRERWRIEEFFRLLKQNLKIKTFVGTSRNALLTQIWTALIAMLLLKWLHYISRAGWSFSNLAAMLRMNLFTYTCQRTPSFPQLGDIQFPARDKESPFL